MPLFYRHKKWFSVLKWDVPPEQLKYVLDNARVCDRHFSEWCFASTLRQKLIKFACLFNIREDIQSTSSDTLSALPSAAFQCTSVEVCEAEHSCSESIIDAEPSCSESFMDAEPSCSESFMSSPTSSLNTSAHLQTTPKTKKIKNLRSSVSKLKKSYVKNGPHLVP
ncbi:hypothetical protein AVEN_9779-1 [Araneus ventricosus]|uniref:THAP-type domain-containing protein n=1 Tax=Araneus ventricosus TaxID=182803 RepID=A0A4Y2ERC0_ARAVE|nr:hypothetical protein AVEN_9779-1 [Araneus ventricosus]